MRSTGGAPSLVASALASPVNVPVVISKPLSPATGHRAAEVPDGTCSDTASVTLALEEHREGHQRHAIDPRPSIPPSPVRPEVARVSARGLFDRCGVHAKDVGDPAAVDDERFLELVLHLRQFTQSPVGPRGHADQQRLDLEGPRLLRARRLDGDQAGISVYLVSRYRQSPPGRPRDPVRTA
jgi:hypothetical protein